ncbi:MAG TPA: hypothetical protein VIG80_13105 [Bacillaceae bacterium]
MMEKEDRRSLDVLADEKDETVRQLTDVYTSGVGDRPDGQLDEVNQHDK